jgi:hypothetical protein
MTTINSALTREFFERMAIIVSCLLIKTHKHKNKQILNCDRNLNREDLRGEPCLDEASSKKFEKIYKSFKRDQNLLLQLGSESAVKRA